MVVVRNKGMRARPLSPVLDRSPRRPGTASLEALAEAASRNPAVAQLQKLNGLARLRAAPAPSAAIIQREDFPDDSTGTYSDIRAKVPTGETKEEAPVIKEMTGTELQAEVIAMAKAADVGKGGFRLGTFGFFGDFELKRIDDPAAEKHGMEPLPKGFGTASLDVYAVPLITGTLAISGQLAYIRKNFDKISPTHMILVDVDCQFDRRGNVIFHKDSRGSTVFVNLTFSNDDVMRGPESYPDLTGVSDLEGELPDEVKLDIANRRDAERGKTDIESTTLPASGRVSFSDPSIWHSTPRMGHRAPKYSLDHTLFLDALVNEHGDVSREYFETCGVESFWSHVEKLDEHIQKPRMVEALKGLVEADHHADLETMTAAELRGLLNSSDPAWRVWDPMLVHGISEEIALPDAYDRRKKAAGRERRTSMDLTEGKITQEQLLEMDKTPRTFIRTWVRMVPRSG